jgi:hypothetical protein
MSKVIHSELGANPEQYAKLGIAKGTVAPWEDGTRTNGGEKGTYEWWYFDSHFDDGTTLVLAFYTKHMMSPADAPDPHVTISLERYGKKYQEAYEVKGAPFSAKKDGLDVHIGPCYITGTLKELDIYYDDGKTTAKAHLSSNVLPWRPETGHIYFGEHNEDFFAWLPSVPEGTATATITFDGKTTTHTGTGYHDHNWGNRNMMNLMNHWYWGRAKIGDYTVITSYIWGEKKYGYKEFPIFMLARDGKLLGGDGTKLTFSASDAFIEPLTGKPVHKTLVYDYVDGALHYRVTYRYRKTLVNFQMINDVTGFTKVLARIAGFDGAYHRFLGDVTLERFEGKEAAETLTQEAIWELMYFGASMPTNSSRCLP